MGEMRDRQAEDRDKIADSRDHRSDVRDAGAEARDERAVTREGGSPLAVDPGAGADRAEARRDRKEGASDRDDASHDRHAALLDRLEAASDRAEATAEQAFMSTDDLTGAYNRGPGFAELKREIARARRMGKPLTLAFVDVDGLKAINDTQGHAAGDRLLREVAATIRSHLRPYDLMIRYGGDEFVCVLFDMDMSDALDRFSHVNADLGKTQSASVTVGLAILTGDDDLDALLQRADGYMYGVRQR